MNSRWILGMIGFFLGWNSAGVGHADVKHLNQFRRHILTDTYFSEGANVGDINRDGVPDVVYGPYWFAGPDFKTKGTIYPPAPQNREGYADNFFCWVCDFNGDGWNDVLTVGFPGTPAFVYENPKAAGFDKSWPKHKVFDWVSNESPQLTQLVGDDRPELVCTRDGFFGYCKIEWDKPFSPWQFHPISEQITDRRFGHGLGIGDVNGDGRLDVLHAKGWFEQPASDADRTRWVQHAVHFSNAYGGAEMYAYDVDGDGDNDVITSLAAHDFGLAWFEQIREGKKITFKQHRIMGSHPSENEFGVVFSELHSVNLVDIDGDGLKDIVTGKTYYSHHQASPMWDAGAVVYWFKLTRTKAGVKWLPYLANGDTGIGRQLTVADVNGDRRPDIVVGGMKGANVLLQSLEVVNGHQWQAAQPKPYVGPAPISMDRVKAERGPRPLWDGSTVYVANAIEGEKLPATPSAGAVRTQSMANFTGDRWSNNAQLWWSGAKLGDSLTLTLPPFEGTVQLELCLTCARDYGVFQLQFDEQTLGAPIDFYHSKVITTGLLKYPNVVARGSKHTLKATLLGANPKGAPGNLFGLDFIRIQTTDGKFVVLNPPQK